MRTREFYVEPPNERTRFPGIELFRQSTPPSSVSAHAHIHESIEFLYGQAGSFTVSLDGAEYALGAGDLILFFSNSLHHVVSGPSAENRYYVIKIRPSLLFDLASDGQGAAYVMRFALNRPDHRCLWRAADLEGGEIGRALTEMIREAESGGYAAGLAIRLRAADLLLSILRDGAAGSGEAGAQTGDEITGRIYAALVYVREHFREDVDARALAARLGVSYSYFSRCFGRIAGQGFKEYLNRTRVNHAEQMLLTTGKSVTEIAAECGYNNLSYFISVYRRLKGVTPRARRQADGEA